MPKTIKATAASPRQVIAMSAPVSISAADSEKPKGPRAFSSTFYTGGAMSIEGWDLPVVVDLAGLTTGKVLVANLDHNKTQRVGNFDLVNDGKTLIANGKANAATAARDEVINSADEGYQWQSSLEVNPHKVETLEKNKTATVNGQEITGPAYITRTGTLKGFGFVSHGADDNTTATIAASADSNLKPEKKDMDPKLKAWIEAMGFDVTLISVEQLAGLKANYEGQNPPRKETPAIAAGFESIKAERTRVEQITAYALNKCEDQPRNMEAIKLLAEQAIDAKWPLDKFRLELLEASTPEPRTPWARPEGDRMSNRVLEAAICVMGRLNNVEKSFDDQTLQAAHDQFPHGIGLNQLILIGAQAAGYRSQHSSRVTIEAQRAAFGMATPREIRATGFSIISIPNVLSNVANKFLRRGWDMVDMTPTRIASIRNVTDFKTITTVSLIGDLEFKKVGPAGEIEHGDLGELAYSNKADTYARMLAITRTDYINDDLGALTDVPKKLGRGSALMLNRIFWTKFLNNGSFFTSGNANVNTGVADMTVGGLSATEGIFMAQTDPDGNPLGVMPALILVPTALKAAALTLMNSERLIDGTGTAIQGDANIWRGRFRVESSPYMSNSTFTGYSAAAWYMLAEPDEMPVIEIVALNGRVEPTVETADADFNVLGVQMRGYSDVGVELQEYRGGVRSDGGSS